MSRLIRTTTVKNSRKPCCKVCQDAGKTEAEWGHWPKNEKGVVICPTLLNQQCRYCQKSGHTVKYCAKLEKDNKEKSRNNNGEKKSKPQSKPKQEEPKNRFAALIDDSDSEEEELEYSSWTEICERSNTSNTKKVTYADIVSKPIEVLEEEKRTQDEERLIEAIKSGMVILKQKQSAPAPAPKPIKKYAKWTDADDDSSDEEDNLVSNDAW